MNWFFRSFLLQVFSFSTSQNNKILQRKKEQYLDKHNKRAKIFVLLDATMVHPNIWETSHCRLTNELESDK